MFVLNKIAWAVCNPMVLTMLGVIVGGLLFWRGWRRTGLAMFIVSLLGLWVLSTGALRRQLGAALEGDCLVDGRKIPEISDIPNADAIVLLGGGISAVTNVAPYPDMSGSADRVWYAARLWRAGKAPVIIPSGPGISNGDAILLHDFGVPREAVVVEDKARNTEENAKLVVDLIQGMPSSRSSQAKPKVLLVTSAWHMRRSLLMFQKYAPELECIPAATDYETTMGNFYPIRWENFLPNPHELSSNCALLHEYFGYWWYRLFR